MEFPRSISKWTGCYAVSGTYAGKQTYTQYTAPSWAPGLRTSEHEIGMLVFKVKNFAAIPREQHREDYFPPEAPSATATPRPTPTREPIVVIIPTATPSPSPTPTWREYFEAQPQPDCPSGHQIRGTNFQRTPPYNVDFVCEALPTPTVPAPIATTTMTPHPQHEFGPRNGTVWHETGFIGEYNAAGIRETDVIMEARFHNPYDTARGSWSYGFMFREYEQNRFYIVVVTSNKYWDFRARLSGDGDDDQELGEGYFPHIRTGETESNLIRLEAERNTGNLYVNGQHVAELDLSAISRAGEISIATNFFREDGIPGEPTSTKFENFTASTPAAPTGPQQTAVPVPTATPRPTVIPQPTSTPVLETLGDEEYFSREGVFETFEEGKRLFDAGNYEAAIRKYKEALELRGRPSSVIENDIGVAYSILGEHSLAVHHYSRSLQVKDGSGTRSARALSYRKLGQCELAKQDAETVLRMEDARGRKVSAHKNAHEVLSGCYASEGNIPQAIHHLTKALELDSTLPDSNEASYLLSHLSRLHYENGQCAQAKGAAERALANPVSIETGHNSHGEAHLYTALCMEEDGRWAESLAHWERALTLIIKSGYSTENVEVVESWIKELRNRLSK